MRMRWDTRLSVRVATKNNPTPYGPQNTRSEAFPPHNASMVLSSRVVNRCLGKRILETGLDGFRGDLDIKRKYMRNEK